MARSRKLKHPPISEALLDVRASLPPGTKASAFAALREQMRDEMPVMEEMRQFRAGIGLGGAQKPEAHYEELEPFGCFFKSEDRLNIAQFRTDGFTLNRLQPYTSWEDMIGRALKYWALFVEAGRPIRTTRIAVRYINRIPYATEQVSLKDLLAKPPRNEALRDGEVVSFLDRAMLRSSTTETTVILTRSNEEEPESGHRVLVIDVDAFRQGQFGTSHEELDRHLSVLRTVKNEVFFGTLSKSAVKRLNSNTR